MNETVGKKNRLGKSWGKKQLFHNFTSHDFCKFIGCIISTVSCGIKLNQIWGSTEISISKKGRTKLHRYVRWKTYLLRVYCDLYRPNYCYACH